MWIMMVSGQGSIIDFDRLSIYHFTVKTEMYAMIFVSRHVYFGE